MSRLGQEEFRKNLEEQIAFRDENYKDSIMGMVGKRLITCDAEERSAVIEFDPEAWMGNHMGIMHGGMTATIGDIAAGITAHALAEGGLCQTSNMTVYYHRGVPLDQPIRMEVKALSAGKQLIVLSMTARSMSDPDSVRRTSMTITYFRIRPEQGKLVPDQAARQG